MTENVDQENVENAELICPITLQLFLDPVKATDGHVYERDAITRWILQHGTSPFTRQPLQITDLIPDDYLRNLSRQRRNSTVSYNAQNNTVTLPPLRRIPRNFHRVAPVEINNPIRISKHRCRIIICIILAIIIPVAAIIAAVLATRNFQVGVTSTYSGILTSSSSKFNRLTSSNISEYYYDDIKINLSKDSNYQFKSESSIDMFGLIYQDYFNKTNPNFNLLTYDDDGDGRNKQFYIKISLNSNKNYILVVTTYQNDTTGSFNIYVTGPTTVTFN